MNKSSLIQSIAYNATKPAISVLLETETTKEIRIAMLANQVMKAHKTPYPIIVEIFNGKIEFGVNGNSYMLNTGDLIALDGNVEHDLRAEKDSIIRLTLSKQDNVKRVKNVVK